MAAESIERLGQGIGPLRQSVARPRLDQEGMAGAALLAACVLAALVWLYLPALTWLCLKWRGDEYYDHGPLLPFISVYLIWLKRADLALAWRSRESINWRSSLLLGLGLFMQLAGTIADVQFIQALSIPVVVLGMARFIGGAKFARHLGFPLLFLGMAVPLSGMLVQTVTVPLQNNAAGASMVLGSLGLPIERVGVNLYTPHYNFIVEVACSGLKIAIALFTMGLVIAHTVPRLTNAARCGLALCSIPVALIANALRICIIVLIGYYYGPKIAEGFLHGFSGIFMFGVSLAALWGLSNLLAHLGLVHPAHSEKAPTAQPPTPLCFKQLGKAQFIMLLLLASTRFVGTHAMASDVTGTQFSPANLGLPATLGDWHGNPVKVDKAVYEVLNPDAATQTRYALGTGGAQAPTVEALVIYSRKWKNFHSPVMCLRAAGWEISNETTREVQGTVQGQTRSLTLNTLTGEKRAGKTYLAYCYMDTDQQVHGWIPTMAKLAGARLLRRSAGVAEVQFAFDPRFVQSNGELAPQLTDLMLRVSAQVQQQLKQSAQPSHGSAPASKGANPLWS